MIWNDMNDTSNLLIESGFRLGRQLSAHKTAPEGCVCVWNANILTESEGKVWFGDLNITRDGDRLRSIALQIGEPLYILREMDSRFGTEDLPIEFLISKAVWSTKE